MKKILIASQVFPQWYMNTIYDALDGEADIDIITGSELRGKMNIISAPVHNPSSLASRFICWLRYYWFALKWAKSNKDKEYDLIFAVSNPPLNAKLGLKLKKIYNAPFVYMNWDLYPDVITGLMQNPLANLVCKIWSSWNKKNYPRIDKMLTIGNIMQETMVKGIYDKVNTEVIPIPVDTDLLQPIPKQNNPFVRSHGWEDKFVVLYSGKMGLGHNIELILDAALKLKNKENIQFVFIGNGQKYDVVENFIKKNSTKNISLFPLQQDDVFPFSMACGDIGIVSQEISMAHLFMPSKTYSMMACGEAIVGICSSRDDLNNLINTYEIGIAVTDGRADTLAAVIENLSENKELLEKMKKQSRSVAEKIFSINRIKEAYKKLFSEV